ncbi:hypothetical protein TNCV_1907011 [Trichonephila clavipes]|nr:hypothetical protein TNCV_1907011 [Trichonephila clavipes]
MRNINATLLAARGLLAMDHIILNHGQVTRTTPELVSPYPNFHTTPTEGRLSLNIFDVYRLPLHGGSSGLLGWNS